MLWNTLDLSLAGLRRRYLQNDFSPQQLITHLLQKCSQFSDRNIWITLLSSEQIRPYITALESIDPQDKPLYGVPFAIKDNIDLANVPTTAACKEFTYVPVHSAFVVERLIAAGAIPIGKTNLDQFATGLVGTRSPWGECRNAVDPSYISGGSSSGSAVAVALGLASFALGTDTAGSGRVPAAMNGIVGLKSTRGVLSTSGVVPACRSLDTVNIFSCSVADTATLFSQCAEYDQSDCYNRPWVNSNTCQILKAQPEKATLGIPKDKQLEFFGDSGCESAFHRAIERWRSIGFQIVEIDFQPFVDAAKLLYQGPWVVERLIAIEALWKKNPEAILPVIRDVIAPASGYTAMEAFKSIYRLQALKSMADAQLSKVDALLTPTVGVQYRIQQILDDPIRLNTNLGYYTNYMNLLDYCAIAIPAGKTHESLPFGISLVADKFSEPTLFSLAKIWEDLT